MNHYPYRFDSYSGALSAFDLGASMQENNIVPLTRGLLFDMQQLSNDQQTLIIDYKKANERVMQDFLGNKIE